MATAIRRHAAGRGPAPLLVVLDCKGGSDARKIADRARRVLRAAGAATTAITLAAARDDQFLVEQDLHEVAAPTSGLLRNRDHQVQQLPVAIAHRVTIFVPEPIEAGQLVLAAEVRACHRATRPGCRTAARRTSRRRRC